MINTYIPYLNFNEKKYILNCFKTNFISTAGPEVEKFEKEFCKKYDFKYEWKCVRKYVFYITFLHHFLHHVFHHLKKHKHL